MTGGRFRYSRTPGTDQTIEDADREYNRQAHVKAGQCIMEMLRDLSDTDAKRALYYALNVRCGVSLPEDF